MKNFFLSLIMATLALSAVAQKASIADINKSMTPVTISIDGDTISYLAVEKSMLDRIKTENGYGGQYDTKGLDLYSTLNAIQGTTMPLLSGGYFLQKQKTSINDSSFYKYPKEHQLASLKQSIEKLENQWPGINTAGYRKVFDRCTALLEKRKVQDKTTL